MLDTQESAEDQRLEETALLATVAMLTGTSARAIQAVESGRIDRLGRRTSHAVSRLLEILAGLKADDVGSARGGGDAFIYKDTNITSGVGRLVSGENDAGTADTAWRRVLELVDSISLDQDILEIRDRAQAKELAKTLDEIADVLTNASPPSAD
ncbi:MAG TPA: hypothetical protein VME67_05530 [Mycobacterium sp.]|nr:hypothetical protein [Mycobacterium sp.]HTX94332.1 hypothetical protein [Mycobacterium sp.]